MYARSLSMLWKLVKQMKNIITVNFLIVIPILGYSLGFSIKKQRLSICIYSETTIANIIAKISWQNTGWLSDTFI